VTSFSIQAAGAVFARILRIRHVARLLEHQNGYGFVILHRKSVSFFF
jgi:hypothetical protein